MMDALLFRAGEDSRDPSYSGLVPYQFEAKLAQAIMIEINVAAPASRLRYSCSFRSCHGCRGGFVVESLKECCVTV